MDKQQWEEENQTFEIDFHRKENYRWNPEAFWPAWEKHFKGWCGVDINQYADKVVLDLGCGSVPAIDVFKHSVKYYIDPLVDKYVGIKQVAHYWDSEHMAHAIGAPGEVKWKFLEGSCSFINCWNVIDHGFCWRDIVQNIIEYARPGCIVSFSTDYNPHTGHTGIDNTEELFIRLAEHFEVLKDEPGYWGRDMALLLQRKG